MTSAALVACCSPRHDSGPGIAARADGTIPVDNFDSVELNGGGHVTLHHGSAERVALVKGSTQYTRFRIEDGHKLVIDACHDDCPMVYDLEVDITMPSVSAVAIDGGGHIEAADGFPAQDRLTAAVNGGGHVDVAKIVAASGTAAVNGGGRILIHADKTLTAAVEGGGDIRYEGSPSVTSAINGGGNVEHE
jgi:hypothetical protein